MHQNNVERNFLANGNLLIHGARIRSPYWIPGPYTIPVLDTRPVYGLDLGFPRLGSGAGVLVAFSVLIQLGNIANTTDVHVLA